LREVKPAFGRTHFAGGGTRPETAREIVTAAPLDSQL
jgi:hypothetical protein